MTFNVSFGTPVPVEDELEKVLRELQEEQNRLYDQQRENIRRIQDIKEKIRLEQIAKARKEELAKLEAAKKAVEDSYENTRRLIEELEVISWEMAHNYQKEDIIQIFHAYKNGHRGFLNANDMGLGKTFEAIATLGLFFKENPKAKCLWLTKASILETGGTEREIRRWSDIPVVTIRGSMNKDQRAYTCEVLQDMEAVIVLTNYETVRTTKELQESRYEYVVMDEVHKLKGGANQGGPTAMWKAVRDFIWETHGTKDPNYWEPKVDFIQMLSGTPMVNRVAEIWAYLHLFDPARFNSLSRFESMYNVYKDLGGNVNTGRILDMCLKDRMVHRKRDEVGLELPKCTVENKFVLYTPEQQRVYDEMKSQFFIWLDEQEGKALTATAIIAQLTRLRQISVWPVFSKAYTDPMTGEESVIEIRVEESAKIDEAMDIIEEAGDQVVVFCNFNEPFREIKKRCNAIGLRCEFITGAAEDKRHMADYEVGFQNGEIDVLCINSSMGEGLNLQKNPDQWPGGSSIGIHLDRWWNPARDAQCNARLDRQGQTDPVFIYMIHSPATVDDFIKNMSDEKGALIEGIMDSEKIRPAYEWKDELKKVFGK